jgi:hypothetical protein
LPDADVVGSGSGQRRFAEDVKRHVRILVHTCILPTFV